MTVDNGSYGSRNVEVQYPGNSNNSKTRDNHEAREKPHKVIRGKVVKVKKSLGSKILDMFVGEDIDNIASYVLHDVLLPAAKSMIYDMVKGSFEMALFGDKKGDRTRRDGGVSRVSYNECSSNQRVDSRTRDVAPRNKARHNFDDIRLDSRGEAEEVLSHLVDLILDYNQATVADLYDLVGIPVEYTDRNYGWRTLNRAEVERVRNGWLIRLPKPIWLD